MAIDWTDIFEKYSGTWVALKADEETLVGNGDSAKDALEDARKNGCDELINQSVLLYLKSVQEEMRFQEDLAMWNAASAEALITMDKEIATMV